MHICKLCISICKHFCCHCSCYWYHCLESERCSSWSISMISQRRVPVERLH
jgi:hypothetical protein